MKRYLAPIALLLYSVIFISPVSAQDSLREELEHSSLIARTAILEGDFQAFLSSIDPINPRSNIDKEQWQQFIENDRARRHLLRAVPDLKTEAQFLSVKSYNDWAAYYAETSLDDDNYQTLKVFLFHNSENGWRPAGKSYGLSKAKPGGEAAKTGYPAWTNQGEMLKTIETDRAFSFEMLIPN